jgi:uncharacterized protein YlxP (DUF503 family)
MNVKLLVLDFQLPGPRPLKEKRQRLGGLKDGFGKTTNLAVTESTYHGQHPLAQWRFVAIGVDASDLDKVLTSVETYANGQLGACPRIGLVLRESGVEIVFAVFSGE